MFLINYKFYNNNILRGILLKKYNISNSLNIPKIERILVSLELKDKEDSILYENFLALNILTYIVKNKSNCIRHSIRYKFGQKHTFVFQSILRNNNLKKFLTFFSLNNKLLLKKKQIDLNYFFNNKTKNLLIILNNLSFFSQLPVEFFKWDIGLKIEISVSKNTNNMSDLFCFLNDLLKNKNNYLLEKNIFYNEIFNYKR